jgi:hypothetical protein
MATAMAVARRRAAAVRAAAAAATVATSATAAAIVMTTVAAIAAAAATAAAATAEQQAKGRRLALTTHQGDANQGEKDRHTQHNDAIHPHSSSYLQVPVSGNNMLPSSTSASSRSPTAETLRCGLDLRITCSVAIHESLL